MTLTEFLRARLAEDEATARAVHSQAWTADSAWLTDMLDPLPSQRHERPGWIPMITAEDIQHIARHDPARVLAEVDAKRRIVAHHSGVTTCDTCSSEDWPAVHPCPTLRLLALSHADHPDYDPSWRP